MLRKHSGTSLIEALIALVIVSFGVLALIKMQGTLISNQSVAKSRTEAQLLAGQVLSRISASATPLTFGTNFDTVQGVRGLYTRNWSVQKGVGGEALAVVSASWADAHGTSGEVTLSSVVGKDIMLNEAKLAARPATIYGPGSNPTPPWTATLAGTPTTPSTEGEGSPPPPAPPMPPLTPEPPPPATPLTISGAFTLQAGATMGNVRISGTEYATCSLSGSAYTCRVPSNWSGTIVTVTTGGFISSPGSIAYSQVTVSKTAQNYVISR